MARVLGVGVATCDIIGTVERYPEEDAKVRLLARRVARGGNAANTLVVLAQLGHDCAWAGVLGDDESSRWIAAELQRSGVDPRYAATAPGGTAPTSYIWVSRSSGSRTIAHYRDIPEFSPDDFARIPAAAFDWVHFEGREPAATGAMMQALGDASAHTRVSLELERPRPGVEALCAHAEVVMFSRHFAAAGGWEAPQPFLEAMQRRLPGVDLLCTWGEAGAWALSAAGRGAHSPARPPAGGVVDPVGAGDTFNAGVIDAMARGAPLDEALDAACTLAGIKCGRDGFDLPAEARRGSPTP